MTIKIDNAFTAGIANNLYLKLDQTTPQTVLGGGTIFQGGTGILSTIVAKFVASDSNNSECKVYLYGRSADPGLVIGRLGGNRSSGLFGTYSDAYIVNQSTGGVYGKLLLGTNNTVRMTINASGSIDLSSNPLITTGYVSCDNFTKTSHYTGFPDRTSTSLGWSDGSYTLTLTATADPIWINGVSYTIDTLTKALTVAQEAASGLYWFWITAPAGVPQLNCDTTVTDQFAQCLVATVYWNTTTSKGIISDERHWMGRDRWNHEYLHQTVGARYASGMAGTFTDTTITIGLGEFYDEDVEHSWSGDITTVKVLYHNGDADWAWDTLTTPYKVVNPGVDDTMYYNNGNALATVDNNKYMNQWVFATADVSHPIHVLIGTAQYATIALARAASVPSFAGLASAETKLIYKITYQNSGGSPVYVEATDYRSSSNLPTGSYVATDHGSLAGLSDDDHPQYLRLDQTSAQTVTIGKPYFSAGIKTPNLAPASDSTTAIRVFKADGATSVMTIDTSNSRIGLGGNTPTISMIDMKLRAGELFGISMDGTTDPCTTAGTYGMISASRVWTLSSTSYNSPTGMEFSLTNNAIHTGTSASVPTTIGQNFSLSITGAHTVVPSKTPAIETNTGYKATVARSGTLAWKTGSSITTKGMDLTASHIQNMNISGGTLTSNLYGLYATLTNAIPLETSGTHTSNVYGAYYLVTGATTSTGVNTAYGQWVKAVSSDNNYGLVTELSTTTGNGYAIWISNDDANGNGKIHFGAAKDATIGFTGTQLLIQSDVVTATDSLQIRGGTNGIAFNIGATEQVTLLDGSFSPKTTNDVDLGTSSLLWKILYLEGNAIIDSDTAGLQLGEDQDVLISSNANGVINIASANPTTTDITLNFGVGATNAGVLSWKEDEDYFEFGDGILMNGAEQIYFNSTTSFISAPSAGVMEYTAGTSHSFYISTAKQVVVTDGAFAPYTDSDVDLGDSSHYFKNCYVDVYYSAGSAGVSGTFDTTDKTITVTNGIITAITPIA